MNSSARADAIACYVVLSPIGDLLAAIGGYQEPAAFVAFLTEALSRDPASM